MRINSFICVNYCCTRSPDRDSQYPTLWKKDDVLEVPRVSYSDSMSYGGEGTTFMSLAGLYRLVWNLILA